MKPSIHLNALRAFEASARHRSFSAAAQELNVTPAAVGQLVRRLEQWLGTALFERGPTGRSRLHLTDTAERALPDILAGFDRLGRGMELLKQGPISQTVTITVSPAFAAKWLLPRIERFQTRWPNFDVRLDTNHKLVDFAAQRVDLGVRYGPGNWQGLLADQLMEEELYPVCAPKWLNERDHLQAPSDLASETLIHDLSMDGYTGFPSWNTWFDKAGAPEVDTTRGLKINNSSAVLQAAIDGQGIALARSVMAREDLAAGRLVRLFPSIDCASSLAYYVVYPAEYAGRPGVAAMLTWLSEEASMPSAYPH